MTEQMTSMEPAVGAQTRHGTFWGITSITAVVAAGLFLSFFFQYKTPQVADWAQFSFYDPGTVLKGEMLLRKGYVPTVDFGYTHGLLSLVYGRVGFELLGLTPGAYLALTLLTEIFMAWALARIFVALKLGWPGVTLFVLAIPIAIMPAYLTLTHPLEAMLILLSLADQAQGKRGRSLALLTVCLFVKPSMAYVYGFVLLVLMAVRAGREWRAVLRDIVPAGVMFVVIFLGLSLWVGVRPVVETLIPLTGAKTYAATGFGFFAPQGRAFWASGDFWTYVVTPAGIFLLGAMVSTAGAIVATGKRLVGKVAVSPPTARRFELLLTVGILHTAFLLGFYGWKGSWTYYSYLPMLGLVISLELLPKRQWLRAAVTGTLGIWILLSHAQMTGSVIMDQKSKQRTESGLWVYPEQINEMQQMIAACEPGEGEKPRILLMSVGYVQGLPANVELPDSWFPEPGIPTKAEISRVQRQAEGAEFVILWNEYGLFDLWNSREYAQQRAAFEELSRETHFTLLRRRH